MQSSKRKIITFLCLFRIKFGFEINKMPPFSSNVREKMTKYLFSLPAIRRIDILHASKCIWYVKKKQCGKWIKFHIWLCVFFSQLETVVWIRVFMQHSSSLNSVAAKFHTNEEKIFPYSTNHTHFHSTNDLSVWSGVYVYMYNVHIHMNLILHHYHNFACYIHMCNAYMYILFFPHFIFTAVAPSVSHSTARIHTISGIIYTHSGNEIWVQKAFHQRNFRWGATLCRLTEFL